MNGVVIIDKPSGLTSHDVVNRVRRILGQKAVGHLGTLDPSATGVLPLVVGNFTRLAQFFTHSDKKYEGAIRFGFATDTYDAEGEPISPQVEVTLNIEELRSLAAEFVGMRQQMPPPFSAKKIAGVPAYKLARKQKPVELKAAEVEIRELTILSVTGERATFRAHVSSGTYLRSIAHELGQKLGCGAHLAELRRTAVADFSVENAHSLEELAAAMKQGSVESMFIHPRMLLPQMPSVTANEDILGHIRAGRAVNLPDMSRAPQVKVFCGQRELVAIANRIAGTLFHPSIVFSVHTESLVKNHSRQD